MRLEADSGVQSVVAQFTLRNNFKQQDRFSIVCFKGEKVDERAECQTIPSMVILSPNASRKIKVKLETTGDGMYRVCSVEEPDEYEYKPVITRVCALVGVGVPAVPSTSIRPKRGSTADAMATGSRQGAIR